MCVSLLQTDDCQEQYLCYVPNVLHNHTNSQRSSSCDPTAFQVLLNAGHSKTEDCYEVGELRNCNPAGKTELIGKSEHRRRLGITSQTETSVDIDTKETTATPARISSRKGGLSWQ
ncbi:calcium-regulated heat stable protein 1 [Platysternon megacephalum]|uniref:Calcium-regulated heat stable protein 1 n=1 Tax=Platysternon megacephalum TaxID=55544 RepID=A0A4D9EL24_9SAUR|nr:calcium-regulated heat stable protein 1 [Platysternon megacephalum]